MPEPTSTPPRRPSPEGREQPRSPISRTFKTEDIISWEIEEADYHLNHLQDFNKIKISNYNWFNKNGETDLHHHLSQNLTHHHHREEFMEQDQKHHYNIKIIKLRKCGFTITSNSIYK